MNYLHGGKLERSQLPFVWKTRKFRGEFKWNGSSRSKFSGKKVMPFGLCIKVGRGQGDLRLGDARRGT